MGRALEVIAGLASAPGATLTTLTPSTGSSFTVRGTDPSKKNYLMGAWAFNTTAGTVRVTSPRLHDQIQGMRWRVTAAQVAPLFPGPVNAGYQQNLYAQDNITVQLSGGGGAEIDVAALLIGYEDLGGVSGRFIDLPTLQKNGQNVVTVEVTVTGVATGNFGGSVAINSSFDNLIANTDYAVLGGIVDTRCNVVRLSGVDLGNLGVGFPGEPATRDLTNDFYASLANIFSAPWIPVINSANKAATNIDVQTNNAGGTFIIDLNLVQLAPGTARPAGQ